MTLVFESNMSKLDESGKPIYREDGKVLKGPNYTPPDLSSCVRNQTFNTIPMENNQVIARTDEFKVGSMTPPPVYLSPAPCSSSTTAWRTKRYRQLGFVSHALRYGAGVAVHLSNIRPSGTDNKGLIASRSSSFGKIYSCLNEQLRRGGVYKNGAVLHSTSRTQHPWVRQHATRRSPLG